MNGLISSILPVEGFLENSMTPAAKSLDEFAREVLTHDEVNGSLRTQLEWPWSFRIFCHRMNHSQRACLNLSRFFYALYLSKSDEQG